MEMILITAAVVGALVGLFALLRILLLPPCPSCASREGFRYDHARTNGMRDRRYRSNLRRCVHCGTAV